MSMFVNVLAEPVLHAFEILLQVCVNGLIVARELADNLFMIHTPTSDASRRT